MASEMETTPPLGPSPQSGNEAKQSPQAKHGVRFWGTFVSLCLLAFISALDVAIITTALPTITAEIGGARQYVWIANSFIAASCVLQPLFGQLADVFGRRVPLIVAVALFALGSALGGAATGVAMMLAGRTIQGAGAGGMYVLLDIVCCDLVPLRERGKYIGLLFSWSGVAAAIGPPIGGALAETSWRWIFYLNLPFCGLSLAGLLIFMSVGTGKVDDSVADSRRGALAAWARRLDYVGNLIFIPSTVSLLIGLIEGGVEHPWSSWHILVPILLGIAGLFVFMAHQILLAELPSVPPRLFGNRTSAAALLMTFTSSVLVQAVSYFLPVYLQAVQGTTVVDSGTFFLPFALGTLVFAVVSGLVLSAIGVYRPLHAAAFAMSALGFGLFTRLDAATPKVAWVFFQLIVSAGAGLVLSTLLPAIMAPLPENDVAAASAAYSLVRTFGYIWGIVMPGVIFNAVFDKNLGHISDVSLRSQLQGGAAYSFASQAHALYNTPNPVIWGEVLDVYTRSLGVIWWVCLGISLFSFLVVGAEREVELRKQLETDYGLEGSKSSETPDLKEKESKRTKEVSAEA